MIQIDSPDEPGRISMKVGGAHRVPGPTASEVRRRALVVSAAWWLGFEAAALLYASTRSGPPAACAGGDCLSERGVLQMVALVIGLPVMLIGMTLSAVVIGFATRRGGSGAWLGTWASWAWIILSTLVYAVSWLIRS
jgi:hypothetical protein